MLLNQENDNASTRNTLEPQIKENTNFKTNTFNSKPCNDFKNATFCFNKRMHSMFVFVCCAGMVLCAQSALSMYSKSVLSSIEKEFGISSFLAGFIVSSFNIGNLLFVLLDIQKFNNQVKIKQAEAKQLRNKFERCLNVVSKLSSKRHRPRIMSFGSLLVAFGGFVNFTPHLVNSPYVQRNLSTHLTWSQKNITGYANAYSHLYPVLMFGELLQGIGATVLIPLSSSYIDDFASKENSPLCLGVLFVLQNLGPGIGYLFGSWTSKLYVDFDKWPADFPLPIYENRKIWIGAWWLGYLVIDGWLIVTALPLLWFPKSMTKQNSSVTSFAQTDEAVNLPFQDSSFKEKTLYVIKNSTNDNNTKNIKATSSTAQLSDIEQWHRSRKTTSKDFTFCYDFFLTLKRLVANPFYVTVVLGYTGLLFAVGALTTFMPKFFEVVFHISPNLASLYFGVAVSSTMCIGLLAGGVIMKNVKWSNLAILRLVVVCCFGSFLFVIAAFLMPLGHNDELDNHSAKNGDNAEHKNLSTATPTIDTGNKQSCFHSNCFFYFVVFVTLMSLGAMVAAVIVTPVYILTMRFVKQEDKCTAIGGMLLMIRGLGLMPGSTLTGAMLDQTCNKWSYTNGLRQNCSSYNVTQFRFNYLILITLGIGCSAFFNLLAYCFARQKEMKKKRKERNDKVKHFC